MHGKMISRERVVFLWLLVLLSSVVAEETHPGLVSNSDEQDLVADASQIVSTAQKREAGLSNSYGEPLPPDAYGPPKDLSNTIPDLSLPPPPAYGIPELSTFPEQPPGAYGPPAPVNFPSQVYHGPPPPISKPKPTYGPPKIYGPPKPIYGPPKFSQPKPTYGPPKKQYGPPKQSLPKPIYGVPFKPPKVSLGKPLFSPPKPVYGSPKPATFYGPPKLNYGPPPTIQGPISLPPEPILELPTLSIPPLENNIDNLNLPAPIYGTPLVSLPGDLKPEFPLPNDSYGPPGQVFGGPIGPNDQVVFSNIGSFGHYGPPQPDPDPRPPHPGIPAPPTPPHVLYDGWKPIPGVSYALNQDIGNELNLDEHINLDQSMPNNDQHNHFSSAQITTGYANVHQDALANIDLNAIVGGDSNAIDQSKTVFEAHYTEKQNQKPESDLLVQTIGDKLIDSYGAPPFDSFSSSGPYPSSLRQQGAKGLASSSGFYGVSVGNQYVAPNRPHHNLPLSYGQHSGGGHSGFNTPQKPIKFRESVPEGLFENIGQLTQHKDTHVVDNIHQGPTYLPPPIGDAKDFHSHSGNSDVSSVSLSIEPTSLYSLPHSGNPITFHHPPGPSSLYGSPIDSYAAPLLTVGSDHVTSDSNTNAITSTVDGTLLGNLSNLDAAAILKHCPYHEAILKAAKSGEKIPSDLATSYVNSLSSLGSTLGKSPSSVTGSNYFTKDLIGSHSKIHPVNEFNTEKREHYSYQKGKSFNGKHPIRDNRLQFVSDQIQKTSDRIRDLNYEAKELQQKIAATNHNLHTEVPIPSKIGSYSVQIQGSNNQRGKDSIPHEQLLSEGLLQSILQAIEDPVKGFQQNTQYQPYTQQQPLHTHVNHQSLPSTQSNYQNFSPVADSFQGIVLPEGYEPKDNSKDQLVQASTKSEVQHENANPCDTDSKSSGSQKNEVVVDPPKTEETTDKDDNDVAIFFDKEPVTELSMSTSISEEETSSKDKS